MKTGTFIAILFFGPVAGHASLGQLAVEVGAATPTELVATYDSLADTILASMKTEWNLVHSILAMTYNHAEVTLARARAQVQAGQDARVELEKVAALVAQLGNEGDAAVAGIRKRLIEGGHHHNATGEQQGLYDEGFVIVTRSAKKVFLGAASEIGKLAMSPDVNALDAQWQRVEIEFAALFEDIGR